MASPLDGIRVLDLSRFLAGPLCGMLLGDMGAEVIRIEPPGGMVDRTWGITGPDGETLTYKILGRDKKAVTLNLNAKKGKAIFLELVKRSDVVLHNFPSDTTLGKELSYENLKKISSAIILAVISGYGLDGPESKQICFDFVAQARSGATRLNGFPDDPPLKTTVPYVDCSSGITTALGILLALYHREKTGLGQLVDSSLFDIASFITQQSGALLYYGVYKEIREQFGNFGFASFMTCLKAKDGWVMVVASSNDIWERFVKAIGREELCSDPRCRSDMQRSLNAKMIDPIIQDWAKEKTSDEIINTLQKARVACAKSNSIDQLLNDPQLIAREMIVDVEYPTLGKISIPGIPIKLSLTPGKIKTLASKIGEHNEEIYCGLLGFNSNEYNRLKQEGVI